MTEAYTTYKGDTPKYARDQAVIALYREGSTLAEVGEQFGITRERVRQILAAEGVPTRGRSEACQIKYEAWAAEHGPSIDAMFDKCRRIHMVIDACKGIHSEKWVRRYLEDRKHEQRLVAWRRRKPVRTDDDMLKALRRAAGPSKHITVAGYEAARRPDDPSVGGFYLRFGSWAEAVQRAGLTSGQGRPVYVRQWTEDECRAAIEEYVEAARAAQEPASLYGYDAYQRSRPALPSLSTLRLRFSGSSGEETVTHIFNTYL